MVKNNLIIIIVAIIVADIILARLNKKPNIILKDKLPFNYNAQTIPPFGIYILKTKENNNKLLEHELLHWEDYRNSGIIFYYLKYFLQYLFYGYDKMPIEVDIRSSIGENDYCSINYTECVQNGQSITVKDKNFRK